MSRFFLFLFFLCSLSGFAQDIPEDYVELGRGVLNIEEGDIVEGSIGRNGIQPHYKIDLKEKKIAEFMDYASSLKKQKLTDLEVINKIHEELSYLLVGTEYDNRNYIEVNIRQKLKKSFAKLEDYLVCGAGVCRENALLSHLALKKAGVDNRYVYLKLESRSRFGKSEIMDHAFLVYKKNGSLKILDNYYQDLHGAFLSSFLEDGQHGRFQKITVKKRLEYPKQFVHQSVFGKRRNDCEKALSPNNLSFEIEQKILEFF